MAYGLKVSSCHPLSNLFTHSKICTNTLHYSPDLGLYNVYRLNIFPSGNTWCSRALNAQLPRVIIERAIHLSSSDG